MNKEIEETIARRREQDSVRVYADELGKQLERDGYTFAIAIGKPELEFASRRWGGNLVMLSELAGSLVSSISGRFAISAAKANERLRDAGLEWDESLYK